MRLDGGRPRGTAGYSKSAKRVASKKLFREPLLQSPSPMPRSAGKSLLLITALVVASAVLHFRIALAAASPFTADSHSYMKPAFHFAKYGQFSGDDLLLFSDIVAFPSAPKTAPDTLRTPGYPLFLAVLFRLGAPIPVVVAVQCVLHILVGTGCYFLARRWSGSTVVATGAAFLTLFFPPGVIVATRIMSETLTEAALLASFALVIEAIRRRSVPWSIAAGVVLSFVPLIRPIAIGLPAAIGIALLLARAPRRVLLAVLAASSVLPAIWAARNARVSGITTISSAGDENLLISAAGALAIREAPVQHQLFALQRLSGFYRPMQRERAGLVRLALAEMRNDHVDPDRTLHAVRARYYRQVALGVIAEHPGPFMAILFSSMIELTFGTVRSIAQMAHLDWRTALLFSVPFTLLLVVLLISGFRSLRVANADVALLGAATILYFVAASAVPVVEMRFTVPFAPIAAILVSAGAREAFSSFMRNRVLRSKAARA